MRARRANSSAVKLHRSYSVGQLAGCCGVHPNTVRHWQRSGLKPLDDKRPLLFYGRAIRAFLSSRSASRKRPCPPGTLFCFQCRAPRSPSPGPVEFLVMTAVSGNIRATCEACGTSMHRCARRAALHSILPGRQIQFVEGKSRLKGRSSPSLNCDLKRDAKT
jgi:hypothetical protein